MSDQELFELCKEVYKRTGWDVQEGSEVYLDTIIVAPNYTSDYLIEKLPPYLSQGELFIGKWGQSYWRAGYFDYRPAWSDLRDYSDTPLKALLKLVISLDDAGVKL